MSTPVSYELSPEVSSQLQIATTVGNSVCAAVANNRSRGDQNPILLGLVSDPMQVLVNHGLPLDFFANAVQQVLDDFIAFLKASAQADLTHIRTRQVPRGFFRCWACRIGLGAVIGAIGLLITAVTAGVGGAIYVAAVNFMVTWAGVAMLVADGIMAAATKVGGGILAGGLAALIEFICEHIPDTCG